MLHLARVISRILVAAVWLAATAVAAAGPDHPVITEVFQDPIGNDGPVGRDPGNLHQEFIEIYLPPLSDLAAGLDKDALNLAFYEIEGDSDSPGLGLVNYRIDLPKFDLDASNGLTGLPRPSSGAVVLGWVDYVGDPPTGLAGTPSTRIGLVNGGVTSTTDYTFIAINGSQFSGTTNFPVPVAISHLDLTSNPQIGKIEQGSAVYLLVDRDSPGYASLCDQNDPAPCNPFPNLAGGTPLQTSSLLDGFAANDHNKFDPLDQPYLPPTGDEIDLELDLPQGGAFSLLTAQVLETKQGYARLFVDVVKTTEDGVPANEDPVTDSLLAYRAIADRGPIGPTPGEVHFTTSPAQLELAENAVQVYEVLAGTYGRPAIGAANIGGSFGMKALTTPGASSDPTRFNIYPGAEAFVGSGQMEIFPDVLTAALPGTPDGHTEIISVQVDASPGSVGDPAVVDASQVTVATYRVVDPTTGLDSLGLPFQATAFVAVQGLPDDAFANEFANTSLAAFVSANLGTAVIDERGNGLALLDPLTNLADPLVVGPMEDEMPTDPLAYVNAAGAPGTDDLVTTILNSAEVVTGTGTYDDSFNATSTAVKAIHLALAPTLTSGGGFAPSELVHFADSKGAVGNLRSGLTNANSGRGFELALVDTNLRPTGTLESGATDDFGLVVEVGRTRAGSPVVTGEFVFLSLLGGLEGADVDSLDVPPGGNLTTIIYVDLDPLDSVLGVETINAAWVIDGSGNGDVNLIEAFSLAVDGAIPVPEPHPVLLLASGVLFLAVLSRRRTAVLEGLR